MPIDFAECRQVLFYGIMEGLRSREAAIRAIEPTGRGDMPVNGISLDITPWHGGAGLSLRLFSDPHSGEQRYNSADWTHFDFVSQQNCPALHTAGDFIRTAYNSGGKKGCLSMAHLAFLAGADALLDKRVAKYLRSLDIQAPVIGERFPNHVFEYIVLDPDGTVNANYCEIVVANRWTARLMTGK
jgi:hypothetical protein